MKKRGVIKIVHHSNLIITEAKMFYDISQLSEMIKSEEKKDFDKVYLNKKCNIDKKEEKKMWLSLEVLERLEKEFPKFNKNGFFIEEEDFIEFLKDFKLIEKKEFPLLSKNETENLFEISDEWKTDEEKRMDEKANILLDYPHFFQNKTFYVDNNLY